MFLEFTTGAILIITEIRPVVYPSEKPWFYGTLDFCNDRVNSESEQTRRTGTGQSMAALEKILNHEE